MAGTSVPVPSCQPLKDSPSRFPAVIEHEKVFCVGVVVHDSIRVARLQIEKLISRHRVLVRPDHKLGAGIGKTFFNERIGSMSQFETTHDLGQTYHAAVFFGILVQAGA